MPSSAPSICAHGGCVTLTIDGSRYCPAHTHTPRDRRRESNRGRQTAHQRGYDHHWQRAARAFLAQHPICVTCHRLAEAVDHITPHKGDRSLFWDMANWQPLCQRCHNTKTATEDGGFGRRLPS